MFDFLADQRRNFLEDKIKQLEKDIDMMSEKLSSVHSSVSSIASSLSTTDRRSCSDLAGRDELDMHWSCDVLTGIDDGFRHMEETGQSECRFCSKVFLWDDEEAFVRQGNHLVNSHAFGKCKLGVLYLTEADMMHHLVQFHHATGDISILLGVMGRLNKTIALHVVIGLNRSQ